MIKNDFLFLEHILESLLKIEKYTMNISYDTFLEDTLIYDGVVRNFEIIGEASKNISNDFKNNHNSIPWKSLTGMRNILIHEYWGLDSIAIWDTIKFDLPNLKENIILLLNDKK